MRWTPQTLALHDSDRMVSVIHEIADDTRPIGDGVMGFSYPGAWPSRVTGLGMREPVTPDATRCRRLLPRSSVHDNLCIPVFTPITLGTTQIARILDRRRIAPFWDLTEPLIESEDAVAYEFANIDQHSR